MVDPGDVETDLTLADGSRLREEMEAVVDDDLDAVAPGNEVSSDIDLDFHSEDSDSSSEF